jgi:Bacterial Ig-like domain (group 3)/FG-GAP-like repeat
VFFSDLFITADVNGDGAKDIITSHGAVFLGKGDGVTFTLAPQAAFPPIVAASNEYAPGIVAADFNKDGHLDLVTNDGATIRTYFGKGDGTFTAGPAYATIVNRGFLIATDLDGDGNIDLVSGFTASGLYSGDDFTPNLAYALMGNGDGSFQGASALPISYSGSNLADLNDDGHADLVGLAPTPETLTFVTQLAQSNGGFKPGPSLVPPVNDGADSWALGDLNGDGKADLIYLNISQNTPGFYVALGNGDGSFQTPIFTAAPSLVGPGAIDINQILSGIRIADFNHDGKLDIIYSFSDQSNITQLFLQGFAVQLGHGDGTFAAPAITTTYSSLVAPLFAFSNMLSGVADVNGDNFPDVFMVLPTVITNGTAQHETQLFVGKGDGTFKPPNTLTLTGNIKASNAPGDGSPFVVADLNGDGKADLVATGSDTTGSTPTVAIALGNGDGTFQAPTLLTLEGFGYASGPAIADFDGDGKLDLFVNVVVEAAGQGIFPGNGNGTFQTITNPDGTVSAPDAIVLSAFGGAVATDLNDDGKPDLIVGNVVLLNKNGSVVPPSASTATVVTSSLNPSSTGASVTFTATVTSATAGAITGTATFFDGATSIGTGTVGAGGLATLLTSTLAAGSHSITAQYGGDANFAASTSPALTQVVNVGGTAATATTVASSLNPSTVGQSVTFTATSTSATAGTLTGTISFFDGATQIGNPVTIAAGMSTVSSATLPQGTHSITAKYSGDAKFSTSTSPALSQVVNAAALVSTTTTLTGPATATAGASVSFMASVTPASGTKVPTGTVMFLDGATNLGPGTLNGSGSTTFSTSTLSTGTHSITAQYGGDANFATSTSTAASINITAATGNFTLSVSPSSVTVTASQPGMAVVTLTPTNGFNQQVQFSCSNVPEGIDCEFEPHSVTPNGGPVTTMLAVTQETEGNARRRKSTATGNWFGRRGSNTPAPAMKTVFVPVLGCEMLLLAGLWRRRKSANQRGALQFAFTVMLLVTIATFVGGCSNMPNSHNTAATITIIGTGPGNQTAMVPLTINLQK